ncbi:MAG TPA: hypothetical protein VFG73_09555 [Rhodanobacteraceae bacterium]|nr:hypothetical protein [Rhodanobacteraceae bacterium]
MSAVVYSHPRVGRGVPVGPALAFALFGAPTIWAAQMVVGYILARQACFATDLPLMRLNWAGVWWLMAAVDLVAVTIAAFACLVAVQQWALHRAVEAKAVSERRNQLLSGWAVFTSAAFTAAIVFTLGMLFVRPVCSL